MREQAVIITKAQSLPKTSRQTRQEGKGCRYLARVWTRCSSADNCRMDGTVSCGFVLPLRERPGADAFDSAGNSGASERASAFCAEVML